MIAPVARLLAGTFGNHPQAIAEPAWYVHLRLWQRPVPHLSALGGYWIFAEQANALFLDRPYRQRLLQLLQEGDRALVQVHALRDPGRWVGAGVAPSQLAQLQPGDLELLVGCRLGLRQEGATGRYVAEMLPESRCCFQYQGEERQVVLGFAVDANGLMTYDRGVDPGTGASLWGAIAGPYRFQKIQDFAAEWEP